MSDAFPLNSRYRTVDLRTRLAPDGSTQTFVGRRIIPDLDRFKPIARHKLSGDERIDRIADEYFGDAELYWRICDANGDQDPGNAALPDGRILMIPIPLEVSDSGQS
jgi:hypothetical protein